MKTSKQHRPHRGATRLVSAMVVVLGSLPFVAAAQDWPPAPPLKITIDEDPGSLPPSVRAAAAPGGQWRCTFRYQQQGNPKRVYLAGTFNGWRVGETPMQGPSNGTWTAQINLPPGKHLYKFVLNGDAWRSDPRNPDREPDGHSGFNSVLRLGRVANMDQADARVGDGHIEAAAIQHTPARPLFYQRLSADQALFRVRTLKGDVEQAAVCVRHGACEPMTIVKEDALFAYWEAIASVPKIYTNNDVTTTDITYTFVFTDGALHASSPQTYGVPVAEQEIFHTPDWAKHAIWYQIMPDRFRNGDPSNDPTPVVPWTHAWFEPTSWEKRKEAKGETFYKHYVFDRLYGGDIAGLREKLPYLKELGVNAIYLNPVFKADSHHKYNTTNYIHIDDHFGTKGDYERVVAQEDLLDPSTWQWTESDRLFLEFLKDAHAAGFKVIIDGVFNHVGRAHPAFQDVLENGENSRFANWFDVTSWEPFEYNGWAGHSELPVFRKAPDGLACDEVKQHIFNVTRRWMDPNGDGDPSDGIDGWRLDVPNEIAAPFWVAWRDVVKSVNPEAYITGEIWHQADQWLDGKHFDAVMNYEFAKATCAWMFNVKQKISPSEIDRRMRELRLAYPLEATLVLQDLMNSHDTDRLASMAHNPDRAYDHANRIQDNGPNYDNSKPTPEAYAKARLAAFLQMTYVGAPMIYYGDEVGMWGADDPTCRKPMLWKDLQPYDEPEENHVMEDHLEYYKSIVALRNAHPTLRTGSMRTLLTEDVQDVWVFLRKNDDEQLIVGINASPHPRTVSAPLPVGAPTTWKGIFMSDGVSKATGGKLQMTIPALSGVVWHAKTPK